MFVEAAIEVEHWVRTGGALVIHDHLALPQPPHDTGEVLHLGSTDLRNPVRFEQRIYATAESECEAPSGEAVHGRCVRRRDDRMAGVVIGSRSSDPDVLRHRPDSTRQCHRLLDVVALADEGRADSHPLGVTHFADELTRRLWRSGQGIEGEFVHAGRRGGHLSTLGLFSRSQPSRSPRNDRCPPRMKECQNCSPPTSMGSDGELR